VTGGSTITITGKGGCGFSEDDAVSSPTNDQGPFDGEGFTFTEQVTHAAGQAPAAEPVGRSEQVAITNT